MKTRKVYGMKGLLEWHGTVGNGSVRMKVDFTNGSVTAWAVSPATFATSDELTQHIMENSDEFKSGRIRLVQSIPIPCEENASPVSHPSVKKEGEVGGGEHGDEPVPGAPLEVQVADKYDAIEYLKEHYPDKGYTSSNLRTKSSFEAACKECGVEFVFSL